MIPFKFFLIGKKFSNKGYPFFILLTYGMGVSISTCYHSQSKFNSEYECRSSGLLLMLFINNPVKKVFIL
ncbi:hypothetical protein HORM4_170013 [Vibrio harveyi]|nr:hypothetical protein HORM4_170013 [Vibrio harveyi]